MNHLNEYENWEDKRIAMSSRHRREPSQIPLYAKGRITEDDNIVFQEIISPSEEKLSSHAVRLSIIEHEYKYEVKIMNMQGELKTIGTFLKNN